MVFTWVASLCERPRPSVGDSRTLKNSSLSRVWFLSLSADLLRGGRHGGEVACA